MASILHLLARKFVMQMTIEKKKYSCTPPTQTQRSWRAIRASCKNVPNKTLLNLCTDWKLILQAGRFFSLLRRRNYVGKNKQKWKPGFIVASQKTASMFRAYVSLRIPCWSAVGKFRLSLGLHKIIVNLMHFCDWWETLVLFFVWIFISPIPFAARYSAAQKFGIFINQYVENMSCPCIRPSSMRRV